MTSTVRRIQEIGEKLAPDRQQVLLEVAEGLSHAPAFHETMTQEQCDLLDAAIAEADRGEGFTSEQVEERLREIAPSRRA